MANFCLVELLETNPFFSNIRLKPVQWRIIDFGNIKLLSKTPWPKTEILKFLHPPKTYLWNVPGPTGQVPAPGLIHKEVPEDNTKFITTTGSLNSISMTVELGNTVFNPSLSLGHSKNPIITKSYNLPWPNVNFVAIDSLGKKFWCCVGGRTTLSCQPRFITLHFWIFTKTWHKIRQSKVDDFYIAIFIKQKIFNFQITENNFNIAFQNPIRSFYQRKNVISFLSKSVIFVPRSDILYRNAAKLPQNLPFLGVKSDLIRRLKVEKCSLSGLFTLLSEIGQEMNL